MKIAILKLAQESHRGRKPDLTPPPFLDWVHFPGKCGTDLESRALDWGQRVRVCAGLEEGWTVERGAPVLQCPQKQNK